MIASMTASQPEIKPKARRPKNPPLAGWTGGKSRLCKTILPLFPEHGCYVEPFCGAAWLLFKKPPSALEVINDINGDVANLYRVIRDNPEELARKFEFVIKSRELFNDELQKDAEAITPVMRAWRTLYLLKNAHGGRMKKPTYGYSKKYDHTINRIHALPQIILDAHARLKYVQVENLDYAEILKRYDSQHCFFYLDPPYYATADKYYEYNINNNSFFESLANNLANLQGKFLLSINDRPYIRLLFRNYEIREVYTMYSFRHSSKLNHGNAARELVIANYNLPKFVTPQQPYKLMEN